MQPDSKREIESMSEVIVTQTNWNAVARIVARAVLRERHPGITDAEFNKSCEISGDDWTYQYLAGVLKGFKIAKLLDQPPLPDQVVGLNGEPNYAA